MKLSRRKTQSIVIGLAYVALLSHHGIFRVWVLFALPVIRGTRATTWQLALLVGLRYSLGMNIAHAIPSPFFPDNVHLSHFIETASSNLIFGVIVAWLVHREHSSLRDLFSFSRAANRPGR